VYIGKQEKLPVITPGKLTPDLLFDFKNGAYSYFSFKEVKLEKEVSKVASGLQAGRVRTWYRLNCATVDAGGFTQFIKSVHANWLKLGWEQEVTLLILSSSQGLKPIANWIMLVESTNALLLDHPCVLSTNDLCNHIQRHIDPDTMTTSTTAKLHLVTNYEKYKHTIKVVDDAHVCADELLKAAVQQMMQTSLTIANNSAKCAHSSCPTATSSTMTSTTPADYTASCSSNHCPPLTTIEHALLTEYSGCFHCHCFYAGHIAPACTNNFPNKTSYWPLTEADALVAKKHNNKKEQTTRVYHG
jgi:hypothetical protein